MAIRLFFTENRMNSQETLRVCLIPLGCPKNLVDSEKMLADLAQAGLIVGATMDQADIIVINTCGFLSAARDESLEIIQEALEYKRTGTVQKVIVAGCLPSRDGKTLFTQAQGIDAIIGVNNRDQLITAIRSDTQGAYLDGTCSPPDDRGRFRLTPSHTAFLRIADGCAQRCTYCTIPKIRGPLRSRPVAQILEEASQLIADGAREINVIAQDTTSYGIDLAGKTNLAGLLRELDQLDGLEWLRLMYTYPRRFDQELIDTITHGTHILPYVDIPLQHINDNVLRRMGRGTTRFETESLLAQLRERVKGIVLRTTFIVGFPGETDAQFEELMDFVDEFEFDAMGAFAYSREEGTPAAEMPDQIPEEVKQERVEQLMLLQQDIVFEINESVIDSPITVLVDGADEDGRTVARYYGQAPEIDAVCLLTESRPAGEFVNGTIVASEGYDLIVQPE